MVNDGNTPKNEAEILSAALKAVFGSSTDYTFVKDTNLVYITGSPAFVSLVGLDSEEALKGKTDHDIFPSDISRKYRADDRMVLETGRPIKNMVERIPDGADGSHRWVSTDKEAVIGADGRPIAVYGHGREITREIELEKEVESADVYVDMINNMPGGIGILHEKNGVFFLDYINEGYSRVHHGSMEHWRGRLGEKVMEGIYEADRDLLVEEYLRVKGTEDGQGSVTYRIVGEDGKLYWINNRFRRAYAKDGIQYYYASFTDVDEQKKAEARLRESQETLREAIDSAGVQYFTYFPAEHRVDIYALNKMYSQLETTWENYPESFLAYVKAPPSDAEAYRRMVREIDEGANEAACTVQMMYRGVYIWIKVRMTAVKDGEGRTVKAQGYSIDVSSQKNAEERLRRERVRLKTLEGNTIEAFSVDVTRRRQTADVGAKDDGEGGAAADGQKLSLIAEQIPDAEERAAFIAAFSEEGLQKACGEGRFDTVLQYRRELGNSPHWVSTSAEVMPDPETGGMVAFIYTSDVNDEVIRQKMTQRMIDANYVATAYYEVRTGLMHIKLVRNEGEGSFCAEYVDAISKAAHMLAAPDDIDCVLEALKIDAIMETLEHADRFTAFLRGRDRVETLPGCPERRMKSDSFYLDEHRDIVTFLLTDVTEILEHERENREKLEKALAAAENANRAKSEFLSRISHDIRTPMNVISGKTAFALEDMDDRDKLRKDLSDIQTSGTFLLSLINDILDISKIDSGSIELHPEPYPYDEYIATIRGVFAPLCSQKGITLVIDDRHDCGTIVVDRVRMNQITLNLLSNAVKYTRAGGTVRYVSNSRNLPGGKIQCELCFMDSGIGISEKFQKVMFEPFTREEIGTGQLLKEQGTGLGLSIVKRILDLMGGTIDVQSELGKGTNITVRFVCPEATAEDMERYGREHAAQTQADPEKLEGRVLLAEDHPINAEIATRTLEHFGLAVEHACNGAEAVEMFARSAVGEYDAVLMDIQMPVMNGYDATMRIRALDRADAKEVPIIAMTADAFSDAMERGLAAGMDEYIVKPLDPARLRRSLAAQLSKRRGKQ